MEDHDNTAPHGVDISRFIAEGFVRIDDAFSPQIAAEACAILWREMGLSPDNPTGWTQPIVRLGMHMEEPFIAAANTPKLYAAYDALAGVRRWLPPKAMGTFPVRFPGGDEPCDTGWHVDMSFGTDNPDFLKWRANVRSRDRALLMLFLFSDVGEEDAPTRIRVGSHKAIARQLLPHGEAGMTLGELAADGFSGTADCREISARGKAGTVYLCHPFLVHAAQMHRGSEPRFMAQPPLLPTGPFDPALPPSPVQIAIREACGLKIG